MEHDFEKVLKEMDDLYQNAPCGYHSLDSNGMFLKINDTELGWLGFAREEVVGKLRLTDIVLPEDRHLSVRAFAGLLQGCEVKDLEVRLVRRDGSAFPVLVNANAYRDNDGKFLKTRSMLTDISRQKKTETTMRALLESEGKYRSVIAAMADGILLFDMDGRILECNPSAERILGVAKAAIVGSHLSVLGWCFFTVDGSPLLVEDQLLAVGNSCRNSIMGLQNCDGSLTWIRVNSEALVNSESGLPFAIMVSVADISESKSQREKLQQSYNALRELSFRLQHVREAERTSIAREIHDELGSALTAIKFDLSWVVEKLGNRPEFGDIFKGLDSAIRSVKRICTALRPSILDDLGLLAALEWQAGEFEKKTGIVCLIETGGSEPLVPQDVATGIFRIFQETLTNIARHADAANVLVEFQVSDKEVRLVVTDDGKGIDPKKAAGSKSLGILGMSERAQALGGEFSVHPASAAGTEVTLSIPRERRSSSRSVSANSP